MEAPRGVERTGTNGRTHERPSPGSGRPPLGAPAGGSHRGSRAIEEPSEARARSRPCPVPEPREPPPAQAAGRIKQHSLAAAMARGRRPVPFRTWKLRPGTAMVLHPAGCGRVARRRTNTLARRRTNTSQRGSRGSATRQPPGTPFHYTHTKQTSLAGEDTQTDNEAWRIKFLTDPKSPANARSKRFSELDYSLKNPEFSSYSHFSLCSILCFSRPLYFSCPFLLSRRLRAGFIRHLVFVGHMGASVASGNRAERLLYATPRTITASCHARLPAFPQSRFAKRSSRVFYSHALASIAGLCWHAIHDSCIHACTGGSVEATWLLDQSDVRRPGFLWQAWDFLERYGISWRQS